MSDFTPLSSHFTENSIENLESTHLKTTKTKRSERSIVILAKVVFYPLKLTFFEKFDGKFGIYELENPNDRKIRKFYHQVRKPL